MRITAALILAALLGGAVRGEGSAAAEVDTIDSIIEKITALRAQRAELEKQEGALRSDLDTKLKEQKDRLDKLNLVEPKPPVPPKPVPPVPPVPSDPLKAKIKEAFDADATDPTVKKAQAKELAALYSVSAKLCRNPSITTVSGLVGKVREAAELLIGTESLKPIRKVVSGELSLIMPNEADLTDAQRAAAELLFTKLAAALEEIAK